MNTHFNKLQFFCQREPFNMDKISIVLRETSVANGNLNYVAFAEPVTMSKVTQENEGIYRHPMLSIHPESAQQLMDELWRCGLRPTEGSGSSGSLAATEKHLSDMRKIVFSKLKIKL